MRRKTIDIRTGAGGQSAYIRGTRVRVSDVARVYRMMQEEVIAERIRKALPHLTPSQIKDAIEYWRANPQEIEREIEEEDALLDSIPTRV